MTSSRTRPWALVAWPAIGACAAAVAYAGPGVPFARGSTSGAVTITQPGALAALAPGTSSAIELVVSNHGSERVTVRSVQLAVVTADAAHAGCDVSSSGARAAFEMPAVGIEESLAAGATVSRVATLTMRDTGVSQDGCRGASLTLRYASD
jgi:hypothetical protein